MKTLLILRHAKSDWGDTSLPDHERPLNQRGLRDAPRMGRLLDEHDLLPDLILCSSAKRARTTAELVGKESNYRGEILPLDSLYAASPQAYLHVLAALAGEYNRVMVVGHNPDLEELLALLTGKMLPLPTAALAQIELSISNWSELNASVLHLGRTKGRLIDLWKPKDIQIEV